MLVHIFSKDWVRKTILKQTDDEIDEIMRTIESENEKVVENKMI